MSYQSLDDIQTERHRLHAAISDKGDEIRASWDALFHTEEKHVVRTPTQRLIGYAHTAAGVFDGMLLGWKLYRRLNGSGSSRGKKRRTIF